MPYIIEVSTPRYHSAFGRVVPHLTHTAVATLEEARAMAWAQVFDSRSRTIDGSEVDALPESGGSVGPLPDGTVIEVRPVTWPELGIAAGNRDEMARNILSES